MASTFRLLPMLRGVPARLGVVLVAGGLAGGWALWPHAEAPSLPPTLAMDGKHGDRLAFAGDETDIPVRESRIYDTIAMFAQPQAEPRAWSETPVRATVQEAGIRPVPLRTALPVAHRVATARPAEAKPVRLALVEEPGARRRDEPAPLSVFGWDIPGSQHLPTGRDASRALDAVGNGAMAVGSGTTAAVSRTASAVGNGVASARSAVAGALGLD